jgi:hypothetical protein
MQSQNVPDDRAMAIGETLGRLLRPGRLGANRNPTPDKVGRKKSC